MQFSELQTQKKTIILLSHYIRIDVKCLHLYDNDKYRIFV